MTDGDVTQLLRAWREGGDEALGPLMERVYGELKEMAGRRLSKERPDHTLSSTALVHEAYARLFAADPDFESRAHFFGIAARAMRRVLVEHARARNRVKRGGGAQPITLADEIPAADGGTDDLLLLDEALERLAAQAPRKARAVELHYFGGLTHPEIATALETSPATVDRDLRFARAWLAKELGAGDQGAGA